MSRESANDYCQKLTKLDREAGVLPDDWEYRLPTEAEWEYACRAGTSGATYGPLDSTARAGSFDPSPPMNDSPAQSGPPSIYDAIDANDFDLALRIVTADPLAVESPDVIPPPLECCGDADKPEWVEP